MNENSTQKVSNQSWQGIKDGYKPSPPANYQRPAPVRVPVTSAPKQPVK